MNSNGIPRYQVRSKVLIAVRNFSIMTAILIGAAAAFVWGLGMMGPVRLVNLTEYEAQERCQVAIRSKFGDHILSSQFDDMAARERQSRWTVTGSIITEGMNGGFWQQPFRCQVERYQDTWGVTAALHDSPMRIEEPEILTY